MNFSREWLLRAAKEEEGARFSVGGWVSEIGKELGLADDDQMQTKVEGKSEVATASAYAGQSQIR